MLILLERYRYLPSHHHQLMFLELQVDLLLEFHQDLADSASRTHSLTPQFAAYFNASNYIATILRLWGEERVSGDCNMTQWGVEGV